ncbi:zinc transporter ZIP5 [Periplaneta americana]|uniref:zinc transporter ZIP5 n=1 Tax=Periplaneta americana TaxID=6978 RepID=UPI0037E7B5E7
MELRTTLLLLLLCVCTCAGVAAPDQRFFLHQIFQKYGHRGIISYEGFEHLLESLGLGRLVFDKSHALALHKVNGSFQEVHDSLHLHQHSHQRRRRQTDELDELVTYSEPTGGRCLTPQDLLRAFGLEPKHSLVISPPVFLDLCPAIVYELDQRSCYSEAPVAPTRHNLAWLHATLSVLVISLVGLLGVALVPLVQRTIFQQLLHFLVALAVGTMSGDALLHLLPHALVSHSHDHLTPVLRASFTFLAICLFFLLEVTVNHFNMQDKPQTESEPKEQAPLQMERASHGHSHGTSAMGSVAWMVVLGDGLHNLTDGLAIGAAFSGDSVAGLATALAVLFHELPHELGDFAVLLQSGVGIRRAVMYNLLSSVLSFAGMAAGVWLGEHEAMAQWIYAFTAGSFLYISLVDLIPEMNTRAPTPRSLMPIMLQLSGIIAGASIMLVIALYEDDLSSLFR